MSTDINALLNGQRDIHGRLARSVDNLKKLGSSNITLSAVETRIRLLDQLWTKFEAQHDLIRTALKEHYNESEYVKSNLFDDAENTYVMQRSSLDGFASRFKPAPVKTSTSQEQSEERALKTSLPRIKLPNFSGAYEDWPSFRDLFQSVIGENSAISDVERLHYLRSCLQGPAEKLIKSLSVTADNYERAWAMLSRHYENKRELIRLNFATFTAVTRMRGDTAEELTRIYNAITTAVNAQTSIGRPIESHGMDLFNYLVVELFDTKTRLEWESSSSDSSSPPDHDTLMEFITKRILTLNAAKPRSTAKSTTDNMRTAKTHVTKYGGTSSQCALCKERHALMLCSDFKAKTAIEKKSFVESNRLCFNCLGNHPVAKCRSPTNCYTCKLRHHTSLHDAYTPKSAEVSTLSAVRRDDDRKSILLATARVSLADKYGSPHATRVLIDQGSEVSIITEALAQRLRLPRHRTAVSIFGIGGSHTGPTRGKVTVNLTSTTTGTHLKVTAFILPRLSLYEGSQMQTQISWPHLEGLPLADPQYSANDKVELLLGAEICSIILEDGLRKGLPQTPIAQKTSLGWILSGGCGRAPSSIHRSFQCTVESELNDLVCQFWKQEAEPSTPVALTPEEERCEQFFLDTHGRRTDGRYVVRLPFAKPPPAVLAETRKTAERQLINMETKCRRNSNFGRLYGDFMKEYEDLKHMERVNTSVSRESKVKCYLPHHGVLRETSATTKLRVVFNGSQRIRSGDSLNEHLLVGANLLPALSDVLLRWRWHRFVLVADIEKMYRQVLVHASDRDVQRILWRPPDSGSVLEYRLNTVTYGLACAPFLAIRTLRQLADDEQSRFPRGATALRRDCYVDDIVTGAHALSDAITLQRELRELCTAGGFPLRKWAANNAKILEGIPPEHLLHQPTHLWENNGHSTLGLKWHPQEDRFSLAIHPRANSELTKRLVLAETARLFDPMGWLAPVVIRAKILIQSAWLKRLDWDSPLPSADAQLWEQFLHELPLLADLQINRWLQTGSMETEIELHGFADASERGYAAAVYLRASSDTVVSIHLLAAKSKVAPVKPVTLPRLELCAATTLAKLVRHVRDTLSLSTAPVFLWSDSTVTLHWIQGHASRWKSFVANRVSTIQQLLPEAHWRHIPGRENPADCASRGIAPKELISHPLWWTGPAWLKSDQTTWPSGAAEINTNDLPEQKVVSMVSKATGELIESEMLLRFSSLHRLLRVTAWCCRWQNNTRRTHEHLSDGATQSLSAPELDQALLRWLLVVQGLHYRDEIAAITAHRTVSKSSALFNLSPFLDTHGVLRVGGRLKHAMLSFDERHPMIAPPLSWLTRLIIESCHRRALHGGVQLTLGLIRLRFWIPRCRAIVKQALHRCVTCARWRAATPQPSMGDLPRARITPARPFLRTGVDYAGPILIRTTKGRGHRSHKAFIAIFVCLCSKAVHIEVVSNYSTDAFLAAFRRFTSRRGLCTDVYSDCGTTFVGADRALRELLRASSPEGRRIAHAAATEGIKWHFIPPAAPNFGGLWEAAVKSTKHHLRRVIGETTLTFEEMSTFLCQVESCLNSRPLQALSDDPEDISALTPGHFLVGAPLLAVPETSLIDKADNALSRWQHLQRMRDHFWERWSREYLHELHCRPKWQRPKANPKVGDLCLIRSETSPPSRWPLARITKLQPGKDDVVRVVTVRTAASELVRPLAKVVLLPGAHESSK